MLDGVHRASPAAYLGAQALDGGDGGAVGLGGQHGAGVDQYLLLWGPNDDRTGSTFAGLAPMLDAKIPGPAQGVEQQLSRLDI